MKFLNIACCLALSFTLQASSDRREVAITNALVRAGEHIKLAEFIARAAGRNDHIQTVGLIESAKGLLRNIEDEPSAQNRLRLIRKRIKRLET